MLRGFKKDPVPAHLALPCCGYEGFVVRAAARGTISSTPNSVAFSRHHSKRSNFTMATSNSSRKAKARRFDRFNQRNPMRLSPRFERDALDSRKPHSLAVAQLVELPRLRAQNATQMFSSIRVKRGGISFEAVDKEAAAHRQLA